MEHIFKELCERVDSDFKSIVAIRRADPHIEFKFRFDADGKKMLVWRIRNHSSVSESTGVVFELIGGKIEVRGGMGPKEVHMFDAKPALTRDGNCMLDVENESEPMELWQVSRKALEDLFFGS